ncbi:hypothetical protein LTR15_008431 [Elasticomyces elasticus]|nr:hypothetical protein LTR15_008431 [Elasticomyces elasticus]
MRIICRTIDPRHFKDPVYGDDSSPTFAQAAAEFFYAYTNPKAEEVPIEWAWPPENQTGRLRTALAHQEREWANFGGSKFIPIPNEVSIIISTPL